RASFVFPISSTVTRRLKSLVFLSQVVSLSSALLKAGMDAKEEGAMVTPNDKVRNPNSESPQDKATPVNTIDIPNPQINPTPPSNPTPPTMPESITNPKPPS
ncbi:hypothetical protein HN51_032128, partial [Arachis hypogaea]